MRNEMENAWEPEFAKKDLEIIEENLAYDGHVKILERKLRFKMFAGNWSPVIERMCISRSASVAIILYDPSRDLVIMIEQVRHGIIEGGLSPWILEPVAGIIEDGDTAEETAHKETKEEAGCNILDLIPIGTYFVSPGISNEMTTVFCGKVEKYETGSIHGLLEENEDIKVHALPVKRAISLLTSNKPLAAGTMISLQWLKINHEELKQRWNS